MANIKLIGIGGTNGSGKDTVGQMLTERYGWLFVSVTEILRDELKRRDLAIERKNMRTLSTVWNRQYGPGVLTDMAVKKFKETGKKYDGLVIASLRRASEANRVHELGGKMVWVDANSKIRFERTRQRIRSGEDQKSYEEFQAEELAEMYNKSSDKHALSMDDVKQRADVFMQNDGNDIEKFKDEAERALSKFI